MGHRVLRPALLTGVVVCTVGLLLPGAALAKHGGNAGVAKPTADQLTDEQVQAAIAQMKAYLFGQLNNDGSFGNERDWGYSALPTLALLVSGESSQNTKIDSALNFLQNIPANEIKRIYNVGLRATVWAQLPAAYLDLLKTDAHWLEDAASDDSSCDYESAHKNQEGKKPPGRQDHSVTQYDLLGLWEAAKRGVPTKETNWWSKVIGHWEKTVEGDGGWGYTPGSGSTGSMTCAGLTALLVAQQESLRHAAASDAKLTALLEKGMKWMNVNYAPNTNPGQGANNGGQWTYYYLYGSERIGLAGGIRYLNGQDWYRAGAAHIVGSINAANGAVNDIKDTSFALMFLSRGRVPVWITKLAVPDCFSDWKTWNSRPNDIYFLTHFLSDAREGELNWQVMDLSAPAEELRSTPILYYSSSQALLLTPNQEKTLRRYLDLGGLLVVNPEGGSTSVMQSIKDLAKKLYPELCPKPNETPMALLPAGHPIYKIDYALPAGEAIWGFENGVRDLILMPSKDYGLAWQQTSPAAAAASVPHQFAMNLFVYACDRGFIEPRLVRRFDKKEEGPAAKAKLTLGRPHYDSPASKWLPEPLAYEPLATRVFNQAEIELTATPADPPLELSAIGTCDCKLVHLMGTDRYILKKEEKDAISLYLRRGGTILVESVGGQNHFADQIESQVRDLFDPRPGAPAALPLQLACPDHTILTGKDLTDAYDVTKITWRHWTARVMQRVGFDPRLYVWTVGGRPAMFFSNFDLSTALVDTRHWGINGYSTESARRIMANLVIWASAQTLVAPDAAPATIAPPPPPAPPAAGPTTAPATADAGGAATGK